MPTPRRLSYDKIDSLPVTTRKLYRRYPWLVEDRYGMVWVVGLSKRRLRKRLFYVSEAVVRPSKSFR